jgi:hypothetical protein
MFRKFRCGCVAFPTPNSRGWYLIVRACDSEDGQESFFWRDLRDPGEGMPLSENEVNQIVTCIGRQLNDGVKFAKLRTILGLK